MKRTPLTRRTRLRPRSKKREELAPLRVLFVQHILTTRPRCEVSWDGSRCTKDSQHVHEKLTRARGGSIIDPENVLAVCGTHHSLIHDNPQRATELGLLIHSWDGSATTGGGLSTPPSFPVVSRPAESKPDLRTRSSLTEGTS